MVDMKALVTAEGSTGRSLGPKEFVQHRHHAYIQILHERKVTFYPTSYSQPNLISSDTNEENKITFFAAMAA